MVRLLTKEGFEVVTAASGIEGLQLARQLRPAVITLDVIMPDMDGWAVLSALKGSKDVSDIPVVMVTMTDDRHTGYLLGAADYLTKPIDPPRLAGVVNRHVSPGATVLVVDDDPAARQMTGRRCARPAGKWPRRTTAGSRCNVSPSSTPDLIILDLMMPEMDGFDLIDALRDHQDWQSMPIVVVTAKDITEDDRRRLNGSVGQVLQKAAHCREELLAAVRKQVRACVPLKPGGVDVAMAKILLVEDNEMNRDMLSRRLVRSGHQVLIADDGRQGIASAQAELPDLILMDMSLPEIDGWEATRRLKPTRRPGAFPSSR